MFVFCCFDCFGFVAWILVGAARGFLQIVVGVFLFGVIVVCYS